MSDQYEEIARLIDEKHQIADELIQLWRTLVMHAEAQRLMSAHAPEYALITKRAHFATAHEFVEIIIERHVLPAAQRCGIVVGHSDLAAWRREARELLESKGAI